MLMAATCARVMGRAGCAARARVGAGMGLAPRGALLSTFPTEEQAARIDARDAELRSAHARTHEDQEVQWRKLVYRAKQRGFLELENILHGFATTHLRGASETEMAQFDAILRLETPDCYKMILGQIPLEEEVDNDIMRRIQAFAFEEKPVGQSSL